MNSVSIARQQELPAVLARAKEALRDGLEFSVAIPNFRTHQGRPTANLGIVLDQGHQLYVTQRVPVVVDGRTSERSSCHEVPTPPDMLGSLIVGNLLYIHGKVTEEGWPAADIALQARDAHLSRPGLIVGIGKTSLRKVLFVEDNDPDLQALPQFGVEKFLMDQPLSQLNGAAPHTPDGIDVDALAARRMAHERPMPEPAPGPPSHRFLI